MKKILTIICILALSIPLLGQTHDQKVSWWRDARFGMFIHWGPYAKLAGWWDGQRVMDGWSFNRYNYHPNAAGEWIWAFASNPYQYHDPSKGMENRNIDRNVYAAAISGFNPVRFDQAKAESWVKLAKDAGQKYLVITAKHHDGFVMYNSKYINNGDPFKISGSDPLKLLSEACRRMGITFGVYYSLWDWSHKAFKPFGFSKDDIVISNGENIYKQYVKDQLKELVDPNGAYKAKILFLDGQWMALWQQEDGESLYDYLMAINSNLIVNDRINAGFGGHYETPEQYIPDEAPTYDWETCMTHNDSWGYKNYDDNWKSPNTLIHTLIGTASKDGNLLLNVGPTANGQIPSASVDAFTEMGKWLAKWGKSIYNTQAITYGHKPWWTYMTRTNGVLYIHILNGTFTDEFGGKTDYKWPENKLLTIGKLKNKVNRAYVLNTPSQTLKVEQSGEAITIHLPDRAADPHCTVIALEVDGMPEAVLPQVRTTIQAEHYSAMYGVGHWKSGQGVNYIGNIEKGDWMLYNVNIPQSGEYQVEYRVAGKNPGARIDFMLNGATLASTGNVHTGGWENFTTKTAKVYLAKGTQAVKFFARGGFWNLDWFRLNLIQTTNRHPLPGIFQAEDNHQMGGSMQKFTEKGITFLGDIQKGEYVKYNIKVAEGGKYQLEYRVATNVKPSDAIPRVDFYLDDRAGRAPLASTRIPYTGGWEAFTTVVSDEDIHLTAGDHEIMLKASGNYFNIDWIKLTKPMPKIMTGDITVEAEHFTRKSQGSSIIPLPDRNGIPSHQVFVNNAGEWVEYRIDNHRPGIYEIWLVANTKLYDGGIDIYVNDVKKGHATVIWDQDEGGNSYFTKTLLTLGPGLQTIRLQSSYRNWNLDQFKLLQNAKYEPGRIEAEDYSAIYAQKIEVAPGKNGQKYIAYVSQGDRLEYNIYIAESGEYELKYSVASKVDWTRIEFMVDGRMVLNTPVPNTQNWVAFSGKSEKISLARGYHFISLRAGECCWNLDWFELKKYRPFSLINNQTQKPIAGYEDISEPRFSGFWSPTFDLAKLSTRDISIKFHGPEEVDGVRFVLANELKKYDPNLKDIVRADASAPFTFDLSDIKPGNYFLSVQLSDKLKKWNDGLKFTIRDSDLQR